MPVQTLTPNPRYLGKLRLLMFVIALLILIGGLPLAWLIGQDEGPAAGKWTAIVLVLLDAVWILPGLVLAGAYYRSLRYEIRDDEVVVHVGIWTKSVKHVPYRTVTNIKINRDIFDRWFFDLGSLNIQTAGMSGTKGAEEKLVGLPNVHEIYDVVGSQLRRFRGGMDPTAAGEDGEAQSSKILGDLLTEVRAIRKTLEK